MQLRGFWITFTVYGLGCIGFRVINFRLGFSINGLGFRV